MCLLLSILTVEGGEQQGGLNDQCPTCVDSSIAFAIDGQVYPLFPLSGLFAFAPRPGEGSFTRVDLTYHAVYRGPPRQISHKVYPAMTKVPSNLA